MPKISALQFVIAVVVVVVVAIECGRLKTDSTSTQTQDFRLMFTAIDPVFGTHLKIEIFARVYLNLYNCIIGTFIAIIIDRSLSLTED